MYRTNISMDAEQIRALKQIAVGDRCSVAEVVRRAVDSYIASRLTDETGWRERLDEFLARMQARLPADVAPGEVEADISAAREEARVLRRASGRR